MAEYIEREGLMHELGPYEENNFSQEMSVILKIVAGRPAADVAQVVHGRWSETGIGIIICSECGNGYNLIARYANFCPNCGAKMQGEVNE